MAAAMAGGCIRVFVLLYQSILYWGWIGDRLNISFGLCQILGVRPLDITTHDYREAVRLLRRGNDQ